MIVASAGLLGLGVLATRFLFVDRASVARQADADADAERAAAPM